MFCDSKILTDFIWCFNTMINYKTIYFWEANCKGDPFNGAQDGGCCELAYFYHAKNINEKERLAYFVTNCLVIFGEIELLLPYTEWDNYVFNFYLSSHVERTAKDLELSFEFNTSVQKTDKLTKDIILNLEVQIKSYGGKTSAKSRQRLLIVKTLKFAKASNVCVIWEIVQVNDEFSDNMFVEPTDNLVNRPNGQRNGSADIKFHVLNFLQIHAWDVYTMVRWIRSRCRCFQERAAGRRPKCSVMRNTLQNKLKDVKYDYTITSEDEPPSRKVKFKQSPKGEIDCRHLATFSNTRHLVVQEIHEKLFGRKCLYHKIVLRNNFRTSLKNEFVVCTMFCVIVLISSSNYSLNSPRGKNCCILFEHP